MELGTINSFAVRTTHLAECIAEAHKMGYGPGRHRRPWNLDFQRLAAPVYAETLPPTYLRGMADTSRRTARFMAEAEIDKPDAVHWEIVVRFLQATADALVEDPKIATISPEVGLSDLASAATGLVRYERLAELLHPQGAARLQDAASSVARYCQARLGVAPTAQELEWIISVAVNEPIEQLAERSHMSPRGVYHRLETLWKRLGVSTPVQGVALAVQRGWIAPPPYLAQQSDQEGRRH